MRCLNCRREIPDAAKRCEFCEAPVQAELTAEGKEAVRETLKQMPPELLEALQGEFNRSDTADEFVNSSRPTLAVGKSVREMGAILPPRA